MFTVKIDTLFQRHEGIKYITGWDDAFKPFRYTGALYFYPGNPSKLVNVDILADRNDLKEEDIYITLGDRHNSPNIELEIERSKDLIYEMCKSCYKNSFVLDVEKLQIVEIEHFTEVFPVRGLNTIFVFENVGHGKYFCLVNVGKSVGAFTDNQLYTWLLSYIHSYMCCLTPQGDDLDYGKQFMQAMASLSTVKGNKLRAYATNDRNILNCGISDIGEGYLPLPGDKTERFKVLIDKSMKQMYSSKNKGKQK